MAEFVKAAQAEDIPAGQGKLVEAGGQQVAVFNVDGTYYAIGNACTHQGGPLADGPLNGKAVMCPWHAARFDVTSGEALSPPARGSVACYRVRVQGDFLEVEI